MLGLRVPRSNVYSSGGRARCNSGVGLRYALTPKEMPAQRYASLCEVYGVAPPAPPSPSRPPPPLLDNASKKEFAAYAKKAPHHRSSRVIRQYLRQLGVPESALQPKGKGGGRGRGGRRPAAAAEEPAGGESEVRVPEAAAPEK